MSIRNIFLTVCLMNALDKSSSAAESAPIDYSIDVGIVRNGCSEHAEQCEHGDAATPYESLDSALLNEKSDRYPYMTFIYFEGEDDAWQCAGTLVATDVILSSAHCMPSEGEDYMGEVTIGSQEGLANVIDYIIHPTFHFNDYPDNDVSLIKIDRCVDVKPVILNNSNDVDRHNQEAIVLTAEEEYFEDEEEYGPTVIRESSTMIDSVCEPWRSRTDLGTLTENMICASEPEPDTANGESSFTGPTYGDSGGPLLIRGNNTIDDVQVGIISFGYRSPDQQAVPSVFARVSSVHDWVQSSINGLSSCLNMSHGTRQ